ncbi:MAG: alpha/beta hydrolase [Clostridiales bacterium]|nr:alpha/beta hydrolase [Clostridiales bacterium]
MKIETFTAEDGKAISLKVWDDVQNPRGVLQLIHGMAEHVSRYNDFAAYMNGEGFIVVGDDHRAHGDTDPDALGLAGEGDLFEKTVADEKGITALIKERYGLPVVVLGHSYGSFLTQRYLTLGTQDIAGCILMGSAAMTGFVPNMGRKIAAKKLKKGEKDARGNFFAAQTFMKYDKKIKDGTNGWLCRDAAEVGKFNTDPQCNFTCSNGFYYYFFGGMQAIARNKGENIRKDLPLLIISGDADGVGGYGKLVKKLYKRYVGFGLQPELQLIAGARHELLNETNKREIYETVRAFAEKSIARA